MKWIALKHPDRSTVDIVRMDTVQRFACGASGEGLLAQSYGDGLAVREIVNLPPHSPARILLDALNGPVGEVPYK